MKKLMVVAACGMLAACGSNEAEEPVEPIETTAPAGTTDTATAGQMAGTYEMTMDDGTVVRQQVNADGTYVDTDLEGNELERGTWRQQGDQLCYDDAGADPEVCWTGGTPGADGSFEATATDGTSITVRRVQDEPAM
ncbi:hypothetical protein K3148_12775 [Qipengyuania aurantiaca]|uniref:Lipoprotein n=1 Tax=Qipengyuania aurantiaca TaxID=2867233 RepID=A0ABX8ZNF2_9SPHN|nr:hypothetical protein [Qipengyuania aurantiaca]QZD89659.1 hypothetical protein K3148_12775 [Qipengyuania aurantiaca]